MKARVFVFGNVPAVNVNLLESMVDSVLELFKERGLEFVAGISGHTNDYSSYMSMYVKQIETHYGLEIKISHATGLEITVVCFENGCMTPGLTEKLFYIGRGLSEFELEDFFDQIIWPAYNKTLLDLTQ